MTSGTEDPSSQAWPYWWWPGWMLDAMRASASALAPQSLVQPILPGWTFGNLINVTEANSSSPDTERDIVARESYGRQLGRVIDALEVLIGERPKDLPARAALDQLLDLSGRIKEIKAQSLASRVKRVEAELVRLKKECPDEYRRIASTLTLEA
jgi:hypothetical protein